MKLLWIIPKTGVRLKGALKNKELELRGRSTFYQQQRDKWKHSKYPGWINISQAKGGVIIAKVQTKKVGEEWKLLSAFIGYLDRNFSDNIDTISIHYR